MDTEISINDNEHFLCYSKNILGSDDTNENKDGDKVSNNLVKFNKKEYIQLHLFQKKYDNYKNKWCDNICKHICSIFLNDTLYLDQMLDINNINSSNINPEKISDLLNINYFYENYHKNYNDIDLLYNFIENFEILDDTIINKLNNIFTGMYFNTNNICMQILLYLHLTTNIGHNGSLIHSISYNKYSLNNTLNHYFNNQKSSFNNIVDETIITEMVIMCDNCSNQVSHNLNDLYYHNNTSGELCEKCYFKKKKLDISIKQKYKNIMLLQGKRVIFKRELNKTKEFLKKYKIKKIKKKNYYTLIENINNTLIKSPNYTNFCGICCDILIDDIYVGSSCGHCFHKSCIKQNLSYNCPTCRKSTPFIKLYFNNINV